jgi:uncharacterized damage-inducible protein DinB
MINLELLTSLYHYNRWANHRMLDAMKDLSPADFDRDLAGSFPSLHQTLVHILWVEQLFLRRWCGVSTADIAGPPKFNTVTAIRTTWEDMERERDKYWRQLTDADLTQTIDYVDTRGNPSSMILWESMCHLFNHSTFHRGQAASKLRQLGIAPPSTDFVIYCRETMKDRQD